MPEGGKSVPTIMDDPDWLHYGLSYPDGSFFYVGRPLQRKSLYLMKQVGTLHSAVARFHSEETARDFWGREVRARFKQS